MDIWSVHIILETALPGTNHPLELNSVVFIITATAEGVYLEISFCNKKNPIEQIESIKLDSTDDTENVLANTFLKWATVIQAQTIRVKYEFEDRERSDMQQVFTLDTLLQMRIKDEKISYRCTCTDSCECDFETYDWDKKTLYKYFRDEILQTIQFELQETHAHKKNKLKIQDKNCPITQEPITLPCIELYCGHMISKEAWPKFKKSFVNDCCKRACPLCREKFAHGDWISLS